MSRQILSPDAASNMTGDGRELCDCVSGQGSSPPAGKALTEPELIVVFAEINDSGTRCGAMEKSGHRRGENGGQ